MKMARDRRGCNRHGPLGRFDLVALNRFILTQIGRFFSWTLGQRLNAGLAAPALRLFVYLECNESRTP
jgi:hypothetical protein